MTKWSCKSFLLDKNKLVSLISTMQLNDRASHFFTIGLSEPYLSNRPSQRDMTNNSYTFITHCSPDNLIISTLSVPAIPKTSSFVLLAVHGIPNILLMNHISAPSSLLLITSLMFQASQPYKSVDHTEHFKNLNRMFTQLETPSNWLVIQRVNICANIH